MKIELVISKIQNILDKNHNIKEKKTLRVLNGRINFACPVCGDSYSNINAKRGNLYLANFNYVCYNSGCSIHRTTFSKFLEHFNENIDLSLIEEIYEIQNKKTDSVTTNFNIETSNLLYSLEDFKKVTNFVEYGNFKRIDSYLEKRDLVQFKDRIKIDIKRDGLWILNLIENKIIGAQFRNFSTFKPKYVSFPWSHLCNLMSKKITINDEILEILDRESLIYNLFYLNKYDKINILEGPIDSFFIKNSISITGLHKTSLITSMFEDDSYRFILDNDDDANKIAVKLIKLNSSIFSWNKFITNEIKNNQIKIKDVNDVFIFNKTIGQNIIKNKYFIDNLIDWNLTKKFEK